jgi:amino acid adenylation domain-containing protein
VTSVVEMLTAQVERTPHATALVDGERRFDYRELDARANALARALVAIGVTVETRVGVCCDRSAEMIVAVLGIVKAGAAYVPIDPEYPAARRELIVADAQLVAVVTQRELASHFAVRTVCVDLAAVATREPPRVSIRGDHALYVLYTSGSTGRPKGVIGLHGATANRLRWQQHAYPFASGEVASARTTLGFVDSVAEIFAPLAFGVPLVMIGGAAQRDPMLAIEELARNRATRIVLVPSLLATMLDVIPDLARRAPALRYWFVGGEPVPVALAERFRCALPGRKLVNIYGATELAADATSYDFDAMPDGLATSPIGVPLPGVHARILDPDLHEVTHGETGEICVSGICLARGYHARAELTVERFVPNPFPEGGRLYRTRDLGRRLPTGDIQYLGRLDQLVKIRGVRIELGEVEAIVGAAPGVSHAVAVARGEQLVAFYTAERDLSAGELRAFVADRAPAAAVPSRFIRLERFPINPNGKVDRKRLVDAPLAPLEAGAPPATDDERCVAEVWQAILGHASIGRSQNFFDSGGTSLAAMRVAAKLRERCGVHLPVSEVFAHPTVASLAARIATAMPRRAGPVPVASGRPMPASLPLSHFQFPFWLFRAVTGGVSIVADTFAFSEPVDVERLQAAFSRTVAAFDALWMRYPRFRPVQEISPRRQIRFEVVERGDPVDEAARNNSRPFDLMAPPHVHARLVRGPGGDRLVVAIPHVAVDMAAMELFRRHLEACYDGVALPLAGGASLLDLVEWERRLADDGVDAAYWATIARGPATNHLPARLFARRRTRAFTTRHISPAQLERLARYARDRAVSVPLAMIGAIYAALARVVEADDPTLLVMIEKRDRAELRDLFTNLTALMTCRVDSGRADVADVADRVARQLVASAEHTDHVMRRPTSWNDFWTRAPRPLRRAVEALSASLARRWSVAPELVAQYVFALVPIQRRGREVMVAVNVMPEVSEPSAGGRIVRRRDFPALVKSDDLITGADVLLDRTLQIHVTNAGGVAVNLYGGGLSQQGLDEITDRIVSAFEELA